MNWSRYSVMSPEHKEEYNYRFRFKYGFSGNWLTSFLIVLGLYTVIELVYFFTLYTPAPEFEVLRSSILQSSADIANIGFVLGMCFVLMFALETILAIVEFVRERRWLRERGYL